VTSLSANTNTLADGARADSGLEGISVPPLYCPSPVRIDERLGAEIDELLIAWVEEVGIFAGQLDHVRACHYGRYAMLIHPDTDDPDRLLLAAQCLAAWFYLDDHYCDDERAGAVPARIGPRLTLALSALDPAHLVGRYATELENALRADLVLVGLRAYIDRVARYATPSQVARVRHESFATLVSMSAEAAWRIDGHVPPTWEYLAYRQPQSFLLCLPLIDVIGGYELPVNTYFDPQVRRATVLAASATVLANDLYSMAKETIPKVDTINLPLVIAREQNCSFQEAMQISVSIHDDVVRAFEAQKRQLMTDASPELKRFLAGLHAWIGGSREWHSSSGRYRVEAMP